MAQRIDPPGLLPRPSSRRGGFEEPIEVRRYLDALRRNRWLILAITAVLTAVVVVVSASLPNRYKATASIVKRVPTGPYESINVDSLTRELATIDQLLTTSTVLDAAARKLPGESGQSLAGAVRSSVDPNANLIFVSATAESPPRAADIANAVAQTFVAEQADVTRRQYEAARAGLLQELDRVRNEPGASTQEQAIRQRLSELGVSLAAAGTDLSVAQSATPPSSPTSPKPVRNGVLAFFLGLFIGVLVALARDQLVPRVGSTRELSRLLDMPVLAIVPHVRRRFGLRPGVVSGLEYEAYQSLGASVRFGLPPDAEPRVVLVTSTLHAEGKTTVTAQLGRALAQAGHRTLLVSADLRWPTLHTLLEAEPGPGLSDLLQKVEEQGHGRELKRMLSDVIAPVQGRGSTLHLLPTGAKVPDPARLLAGPGLDAVLDALMDLDYAYVLVDSAPILGIADTQALARHVRHVLFVARPERLTLDAVYDGRDVLDRFDLEALGLVVVGARSEASPYYLSAPRPASTLEEA